MLFIAILSASISAQLSKPPEFSDTSKVQSAKPAALETTSHASAERAEVHEGLLRQLRALPNYATGLSLIEKRLNGPAEEWFVKQNLPLGIAVIRLLNGREAESADMLCKLAQTANPPQGLIAIMGESIGISKPHASRMLEAMQKLAQPADAASQFALGLGHLRQTESQTDAGLSRLREAAKLDPKDTRALIEIAKQETILEHRQAAITALEEALKRDEKLATAHYRLAQLYRLTGQPDRATQHMQRYKTLIAASR